MPPTDSHAEATEKKYIKHINIIFIFQVSKFARLALRLCSITRRVFAARPQSMSTLKQRAASCGSAISHNHLEAS